MDYGPVYITEGPHKGRIGYYDDEDTLFNDEVISTEFEGVDGWNYMEEEPTIKTLQVSIVYFGDFFLSENYSVVLPQWMRSITTDDLLRRREEISRTQGLFAVSNKVSLDNEEKFALFRELHYVESLLVDRMIEARYINGESKATVFISHASSDKQFAKWIATDLKAAGHNPWLDDWAISVGESIPQKISEGLSECDFIIVILSQSAVKSKWVQNEWQPKYWDEINNDKVQVLPILYEDCSIPELLKTKRYADFRNNYNNGLDDLLITISKLSVPDKMPP